MSLQAIAERIPAEYRTEILETNMVSKAQAIQGNPSMHYLFTIWKNYVEPTVDLDMECAQCLTRILNNYSQLMPAFIELEKQQRLLKAV
jgi:hypothetical protein